MPCSICKQPGHNRRTCPQNNCNQPSHQKKKIKQDKLLMISFYLKGKEPDLVSGYKMDGRHIAKQTEDIRVQWVCDQINQKTELGMNIINSYKENFGKEIEKVVKRGGNRDHYDILIYHTDGTTKKCEEKGTDTYQSDVDTFLIPWENSVQRFNGHANKYSIGVKYSKLWYNMIVCDKDICKLYGIDESLIPTEEEWLKYDAYPQANPKTEYGKCLKDSYRTKHPDSCMNGRKNSPHDYRLNINPIFINSFNKEDKDLLLKEVQEILNGVMDEKECWLQTTGKINSDFSFKWYDKIESPKIKDVNLSWNEGADIYYNFIAEEEQYNFKCILRFGKGTGFSNLRFDIR